MAWKGLHVGQSCHLSNSQGQLTVKREGGTAAVPVEDLAFVVLDTPQATVTSSLLSTLSSNGVVVAVSDARHQPCGILMPYHVHHLQAGVAIGQAALSAGAKGRLWQQVVRNKVRNQARALELRECPFEAVTAMERLVARGDGTNVEARAAREYWSRFFHGFVRGDGADRRNAMLDYGYAVVRAVVVRSVSVSGLIPCLGIHHRSVSNPFNLADDLMEPFRPIVDLEVASMVGERPDADVSEKVVRQRLAALPHAIVRISGVEMTVLAAADAIAARLSVAVRAGGLPPWDFVEIGNRS